MEVSSAYFRSTFPAEVPGNALPLENAFNVLVAIALQNISPGNQRKFMRLLDESKLAAHEIDRTAIGWHDERALTVPDNVTLALLPPYSPELNPVERVWLYLRERFLSLRVLDDTEAIIDACCQAWIDLIAEPDRMRTLCSYPWIMKVIS